jgi:hypothetical protein
MESLGRTVNGFLSAIPTALSDAGVRISEVERAVEEGAEALGSCLTALEGTVGTQLPHGEDLPPTLWSAVARWDDESLPGSGGVGQDSGGVGSDSVQRMHERAKAAVDALQEQYNDGLKEVKENARTHEAKAAKLFEVIKDKLVEVVGAQNKLATDLKAVAAHAPAASPGLDGILSSLGGGTVDKSSEQVDALLKEVKALRAEVQLVKAEEGDESVKIGGAVFHSKEDVHAWMVEEAPHGPFGAFVDFHSLLQQVSYDMNGYESNDDILKQFKLRNELVLSTNADVLGLASLRNGIPSLFGKGKAPTGKDRSAFHALHSLADWEASNGRDGLADRLPSYVKKAKEAVEMDIDNRLFPGSKASLLAATCLSNSVAFTDGFVKYLSKVASELTTSGFTQGQAWALTTTLGARVCLEVHKDSGSLLRSLTIDKDDAEREKLHSLMLWATLRVHKKMAEFQKYEFKDHPAIASEYVKFLATNTGFEVVSALESKVDGLKKELELVRKSATSAANTADIAKKTAEEAKKTAAWCKGKHPT